MSPMDAWSETMMTWCSHPFSAYSVASDEALHVVGEQRPAFFDGSLEDLAVNGFA